MPRNYTGKGNEGSLQQITLNACYKLLIETKKFPSKREVYTEVTKESNIKFKNISEHIRPLIKLGVLYWSKKTDKVIPIFGDDLIKLFFDKKIGTIPITKEDGSEFTAYDLYTMTPASKPSNWESIKQAWFNKVALAADADKKFPRNYFLVIFLILRIDQPSMEGFKKDYLDKFLSDNKIKDFFKKHTNILKINHPLKKHGFIYTTKNHHQLHLGEKLEKAILHDAVKLASASEKSFLKNYREAKQLIIAVNSPMSPHDKDNESEYESEKIEESSDENQQNLKRKFIEDEDMDIDTEMETEPDDASNNNKFIHLQKKPRSEKNNQLNNYKSTKTSDSNKGLLINIIYTAANKQPLAAELEESSIRAEYNLKVTAKSNKHFQQHLDDLKQSGLLKNNKRGQPICPYIDDELTQNYLNNKFPGVISKQIYDLYLAVKNNDKNFNIVPLKQKIRQDNLNSPIWALVTLWILAIEWGKNTFSDLEINQFLSNNSLSKPKIFYNKLRALLNFNLITKTEKSLFTVNFGETFEEAIICSVAKPNNSDALTLITNYRKMKAKQPPAVPVSTEVSNPRNPFEFFVNKTSIPNSSTIPSENFCTQNVIELDI